MSQFAQNLTVSFLALGLATPALAKVTIPGFQGQVKTYETSVPKTIRINAVCYKLKGLDLGPIMGFPKSDYKECGELNQEVSLTAKGEFQFKPMKIKVGNAFNHLALSIDGKQVLVSEYSSEKEAKAVFAELEKALKTLSVYTVAIPQTQFKLASGVDGETWARGNGRETSLGVKISVRGAIQPLQTTLYNGVGMYVGDRIYPSVLGTRKATVVVLGDMGVNPVVEYSGQLENYVWTAESKVLATATVSATLSETATLRFDIDDTEYQDLPYRRLNGKFSSVSGRFKGVDGSDLNGQGVFGLKLDLKCEAGAITGTFTFTRNMDNYTKTGSLSGECDGKESALIRFVSSTLPGMPETEVSIRVDEISMIREIQPLPRRSLRTVSPYSEFDWSSGIELKAGGLLFGTIRVSAEKN